MATPPRGGWKKHHGDAAEASGWSSWSNWVEHLEKKKGTSICGRMRKGPKAPCTRAEAWGVDAKEAGPCKFHGGATPAGIAHPQFRNGRHVAASSVVGTSIRDRVNRFLQMDPRRTLQLATGTALARLEELLERIDRDAVGTTSLENLRNLVSEILGGPEDEAERLGALLEELDCLLNHGGHADETWAEVYVVLDRLRGLSEAWRKVMRDAGEMVERSRVLIFVDHIAVAMLEILEDLPLREEVRDNARRELAEKTASYLNRPTLPERGA